MTNIDQLQPGPELDALIHLHVFGKKLATIPALKPGEIRLEAGSINNLDDWTESAPEYSTNIAHTWEVVDKIKSLLDIPDDRYGLNNSPVFTLEYLGDTWSASFVREPYDPCEHEGEHQSVSMAICLCALKAVREK